MHTPHVNHDTAQKCSSTDNNVSDKTFKRPDLQPHADEKVRVGIFNTAIYRYRPYIGSQGIELYTILCAHADNETGVCFPSHKVIMELMDINDRDKVRHLARLLRHFQIIGDIQKTHNPANGKFWSNTYILLHIPPVIDPELIATMPQGRKRYNWNRPSVKKSTKSHADESQHSSANEDSDTSKPLENTGSQACYQSDNISPWRYSTVMDRDGTSTVNNIPISEHSHSSDPKVFNLSNSTKTSLGDTEKPEEDVSSVGMDGRQGRDPQEPLDAPIGFSDQEASDAHLVSETGAINSTGTQEASDAHVLTETGVDSPTKVSEVARARHGLGHIAIDIERIMDSLRHKQSIREHASDERAQ